MVLVIDGSVTAAGTHHDLLRADVGYRAVVTRAMIAVVENGRISELGSLHQAWWRRTARTRPGAAPGMAEEGLSSR